MQPMTVKVIFGYWSGQIEKTLPGRAVRFLRQGVRVNGWVLLGQVTLGYELWRIFNGFPPLILPEPDSADINKDTPKDDAKKTKR